MIRSIEQVSGVGLQSSDQRVKRVDRRFFAPNLDMAYQCLVDVNEVKVSPQVKVSNPVRTAEDIQRQRFEKMGIDFNQVRGKRL